MLIDYLSSQIDKKRTRNRTQYLEMLENYTTLFNNRDICFISSTSNLNKHRRSCDHTCAGKVEICFTGGEHNSYYNVTNSLHLFNFLYGYQHLSDETQTDVDRRGVSEVLHVMFGLVLKLTSSLTLS